MFHSDPMGIGDQGQQVAENMRIRRATGAAHASPANRTHHDHALFERLAMESDCSPEIVWDLYQRELQLLQHEARVHGFIPVLALKHVRNALRRQRKLQTPQLADLI